MSTPAVLFGHVRVYEPELPGFFEDRLWEVHGFVVLLRVRHHIVFCKVPREVLKLVLFERELCAEGEIGGGGGAQPAAAHGQEAPLHHTLSSLSKLSSLSMSVRLWSHEGGSAPGALLLDSGRLPARGATRRTATARP